MKRIILAIVIVVFLIIGLTPWITGYYFKQNYVALVDNYNRQQEGKLTIVNYQLNWFNSQVILHFNPASANVAQASLNDPALSNALPEGSALTLEQTITHGPLVEDKIQHGYTLGIASIHSIVHLPNQIETFLFGKPKPEGIAVVESVAHFNQEWMNLIHVSPLSLSFIGMDKTLWQGLEGTLTFKTDDDRINQFKTHFVLGAITVTLEDPEEPIELALQPITQEVDYHRQPVGLWTGSSKTSMPAASFKMNNQVQASIENLAVAGQSNMTGNLYQVNTHLTIDKISLPNQVVAIVQPLDIQLAINNLNATELNHFITAMRAVGAQDLNKERATLYQTVLPRSLTATSTLHLDLSTNTSLGGLTAKGIAGWPANAALPNTLEELVKNATAKVDIRIAIPLANAIMNETINEVAERAVEQTPQTPSVSSINPDKPADVNKETLKNKLTAFMQAGQLQLPAAIQIMGLYDDHASVETFTNTIKQLHLLPHVETELLPLYAQLVNNPNAPTVPVVPTTVQPATNPNQTQQMISTSIKSQVDELIQQGYLIKDNNDYVATLTYENNSLKINGKDIPQETSVTTLPLPPAN